MNIIVDGLVSNLAIAEEAIAALQQSDEDQDAELVDLDTVTVAIFTLFNIENEVRVSSAIVKVWFSAVNGRAVKCN